MSGQTEKMPRQGKHGKQHHQKLKPYVVLQYLLRYTDENHPVTAADIVDFLGECGIKAERRSTYRDIKEINAVNVMLENDSTIQAAEEAISEDDSERLIIYDKNRKGFYAQRRDYEPMDIRLLAECVYAAKFIPEGQAKRLVDVVCSFVSDSQAAHIRHDAFLTDRVKTENRTIYYNINTINDAMSRSLNGRRHEPEKISFKYMKYTISDMHQQAERRNGARYIVSPYRLLINDGNYYLLAYDDKMRKIMTFRVDRMKDVQLAGEPRAGAEAFAEIDLETYTQRVFSMYSGKKQRVTIRFINPLLDTVIDRFGIKGVSYSKVDDSHFSITAMVEISDQFYGWLLGFGKRAKLITPETAVDDFRAYIDKLRCIYTGL